MAGDGTAQGTSDRSNARAAPPQDVLQLQVDAHGPQWGRRIRVQMGSPGHLVRHGTLYVSAQFAAVLEHLVLTADTGLTVRVVDRSGAEPIHMTSAEL